MKVIAELDEKDYGLLCGPHEVEPLMTALTALYCSIWAESSYDPRTVEIGEYAASLLPYIQTVNKILQFKK